MTIADAFNEITIAQGGTPNYSGTIAAAIDSLNDALAGSDQPAETTIEGAVRLLGQHIGGSDGTDPDIAVFHDGGDMTHSTVDNFTVTWDYPSVKAKVLAGEPVTGNLIIRFNYDELVDGYTDIQAVPLNSISITSRGGAMTFSAAWPASSSSGTSAVFKILHAVFGFDPEDGTLSSINGIIGKQVALS